MPGSLPLSLEEFLANLPDLGARRQDSMSAADFTLDRIRSLMSALGDPQQKYPSIHIAGTNGKGSVVAFCAAALQAQGYKVGSFTSPHLRGALRGIAVNGDVVDPIELAEAFELIRPNLDLSLAWTHFEIVTALAFTHFARVGVDAAIIEVGLGGRLDATNVLTPLVSVITPIDFDHTSILGNTLAAIATEKAGIIKQQVPVVLGLQPTEAREAILKIAGERKAPVIELGKDFWFWQDRAHQRGQDVSVWFDKEFPKTHLFSIALHGDYQMQNLATAFAALSLFRDRGYAIDTSAIERGFASTRWNGRFELFVGNPPKPVVQIRRSWPDPHFFRNPTVVLDAAHSRGAASALRGSLDDFFPNQPILAVLGVSVDKDLAGLLEPLRPRLGQIIATQSSHPRAMPAAELAEQLANLGFSAQSEPEPDKALHSARSFAQDNLVVVFGSVFLVEEIRELFKA